MAPKANTVHSSFQSPLRPCYHIGGTTTRGDSHSVSMLPSTPKSQRNLFSTIGETLNMSPICTPSPQIVVSPDSKRKRKREEADDADDFSVNDSCEQESCEGDQISPDDSLDPISIHDVDFGEDILYFFATHWKMSPRPATGGNNSLDKFSEEVLYSI